MSSSLSNTITNSKANVAPADLQASLKVLEMFESEYTE